MPCILFTGPVCFPLSPKHKSCSIPQFSFYPYTNSITYRNVKFTSARTLKAVIIHKKQSVPEYIIKGIFRKAIQKLCCIPSYRFLLHHYTSLKCESFSNSCMEMVHSFLFSFTNLQKSFSSLRNSVSRQGLCR